MSVGMFIYALGWIWKISMGENQGGNSSAVVAKQGDRDASATVDRCVRVCASSTVLAPHHST